MSRARPAWPLLASALLLVAGAVLGALAWAAAAPAQEPRRPEVPEAMIERLRAMPKAASGATYVLQPHDEIEIRVFNLPELTQTVMIRPDGRISLFFLDDVQAAGLGVTQLRARLAEAYGKHFRNPEVNVIVKGFAGQTVYVGGEVQQPGLIALVGSLTAAGAVIKAGGFKEIAKTTAVVVLRDSGTSQPTMLDVDLEGVLRRGQPDVLLQPGDVVFVPRATLHVYVGGEVTQPGLVTLQGRLSLAAAVIKAGGMKPTAALKTVVLMRDAGGGKPSVQTVDLAAILADGLADVPLEPFDVVYVPQSTIAKVNQFFDQYVRQLLPISLNAGFSYVMGSGLAP
ncbi:MAG: polysaccharide biosynthesis/export family protein [Candidatus Rokubacteria bacterium]|nr:polysaccharide biosynthesis/export family protein [Candidatus Rokubacteria bacterium]